MLNRLSKLLKLCSQLAVGIAMVAHATLSTGPSPSEIKELPVTKRTMLDLYLYSSEVPAFLKSLNGRYVFVDVRTPQEVFTQGTPALIDANIPIEFSGYFVIPWGSVDNDYAASGTPGFANKITALLANKGLGKNTSIVLISNHGERSAMAANMLAWHGYTMIYSVIDGYEGDHVAVRDIRNNGWLGNHLPLQKPVASALTKP